MAVIAGFDDRLTSFFYLDVKTTPLKLPAYSFWGGDGFGLISIKIGGKHINDRARKEIITIGVIVVLSGSLSGIETRWLGLVYLASPIVYKQISNTPM